MLKVENKSKEEIAEIGRRIGKPVFSSFVLLLLDIYDRFDEMYGGAVA